jgi:erythromycin esterase
MRALVAAVGVVVGLTACVASPPQPVPDWISQHTVLLDTVDPAAPLDDLAPLRGSIGAADIVGLGESVHGAAEQIGLKHRTLRLLVEQMGFRSVAWEEDWTTGLAINEYLRTGDGDADALVRRMSPRWQSRQVADVLRWLRDFNEGRADKVQLVGVDYGLTGPPVYDAVDGYVAATAPDRLAELREHLRVLRPASPIADHIAWYAGTADKAPYVRHAHQLFELVNWLPHSPVDRDHTLAVQHVRQIVSFYEHFALQPRDALVYRDEHAAQNVRWWREYSGEKVAYWATSPHTANAPELRIAAPPDPDWAVPSAGSHLRRWYGQRYLSIGFTFHHGRVNLEPGKRAALPLPRHDWFERPLGMVDREQFLLDLRTPAPPPVRTWLDAPIVTRGLPERGSDAYLAGGSLAQWFDVIVHRQELTPALPV